ncbi:double C2-like domain-containing protein gamma isoform X1 [Pongo abelii]|uniref:double C2-like domain-containing protein gamma isoform X1 n=1 Tax=Pongo abelii TaxID=9601 RepID=UPI0023E7E66C|nr:double C2-like domain-containing protein gamma isoform X1 [Pongo abelii]
MVKTSQDPLQGVTQKPKVPAWYQRCFFTPFPRPGAFPPAPVLRHFSESPHPHLGPMAGTAAAGGQPPRVSTREHMAVDVSPGPIRPIRLISHYFPHFYPFAEPALHPPDLRPAAASTIRSAPQLQPDPEPEGDSDDSTAPGTLEFTLLFDADNSALRCMAHRAKVRMGVGVPGTEGWATGLSHTHCLVPRASSHWPQAPWTPMSKPICCQGPGKASQLRTRTVRGTRVPVWEETLTYHGFTCQDAACKTLRLCVCEDPWLRQWQQAPQLGELRVPLRKLVPNRARSFDICLEKRRLEEVETEVAWEERGRVLLSLCYSSQWGGLLVGVLRCAHLAPMDANGYSDPFVRLFLHPNAGKKSKFKTSVRRKTLNPEFNEEFFYSGPREELAQKTLLVSVWDYDLGTADDFIGEWEHEKLGWGPSRLLAVPDPSPMADGVQLGSHASGERLRHWLECLGHSDHRLELWHPLDSKPVQLSD